MHFIALAATMAVGAQAHMFLSSPAPIPGSAPKDPLDASGSNFPCHGVALPSSGGEHMAAGSSQLLAWDLGDGANTAVHGGGSCQMSITYETDPEAVKDPKNWYVIYSIEGGCPSNTVGNLDGSYTGPQGAYSGALSCTDPKTNGVDCVNQFNFTIPKGIKSGHATMAWTWYNTIGNRELYMNCISTQLTGGDGSEMSQFPSMFVANMASVNTCPTIENDNVKFPYPGKYLTTKQPSGEAAKLATTYPIIVPSGSGCADNGMPAGGHAAAPPAYGNTSESAGPSASAPAAPSGSAPPHAFASASASVPNGGGVVTVTTLATITASSASASAPPVYSAPASSYAAVPTGASSSGSCTNGSVSCPTQGAIICIGTAQFGLCDIDNCAVPRALAAGTHCTNGSIRKRDHVRRHMAKHGVRHHH